ADSDHRGLLRVDDGNGVTARAVAAVTHVAVAVATSTAEPPEAYASSDRLARAAANILDLHLRADAAYEGHRRIDDAGVGDLVPVGVVEEAGAAALHDVAGGEGDLERVAAQARLIAARDDVAFLHVAAKLREGLTPLEVGTTAIVVDVLHALI